MLRVEWGLAGVAFAALAIAAWVRGRRVRQALGGHLGREDRGRQEPRRAFIARAAVGVGAVSALLLVLALVGPVIAHRPIERPARSLEIHLAVDLSRSMASGNGVVNRLELGRGAARRLLASVPGAAVSLTVFGERAWPLLPPTRDVAVVGHYLDALSVEGLSSQGTHWPAVLDAVGAGISRVAVAGQGSAPDGPDASPVTLLVTDGEWWGDAPAAGELPVAATGAAGPVHVIWVDTPAEALVPGGKGERSRVSDDGPRLLARATGGEVIQVTDFPGLDRLGADLRRRSVLLSEPAPGREPVDGAPLLAGAAAVLTLLAGVGRVRG